VARNLKKWVRLEEKSQKFGVTRTKNARYAAEQAELDLFRVSLMGLDSIFVLTTRTKHWFIKRGFVQVDPEWLPEARKRKYNVNRKSQVLIKKL